MVEEVGNGRGWCDEARPATAEDGAAHVGMADGGGGLEARCLATVVPGAGGISERWRGAHSRW